MAMIHLAAINFDPQGHVTLQALSQSDLSGVTRRVNRIQTLDCGVAVNDGGYSAGDRTFRILWRVASAEQYGAVQRLVRLYARLRVATAEGVFTAVPERIDMRNGEGDLTLLITEQLT